MFVSFFMNRIQRCSFFRHYHSG